MNHAATSPAISTHPRELIIRPGVRDQRPPIAPPRSARARPVDHPADNPVPPPPATGETAAVTPGTRLPRQLRLRLRLRVSIPIRSRTRISSGSPFEPTIGFSRAVRDGRRVLVSGTTPVVPDGSCPDDVALQARRCFAIIEAALGAAGASFADVVRTRMFVTDPGYGAAVGAVHGEVFGTIRPAATMVAVAALLLPRWKVEIEAEAELPPRPIRALRTIATRRRHAGPTRT
jgi:enamine deaminase RidA (YjgF/YER057c/UK114 family)